MRTFSIFTLGCKVNQYESEKIKELFRLNGLQEVEFQKSCDIFIINTCTVTGTADKKSRQKIRQAMAMNPRGIVIVTGCALDNSGSKVKEIPGKIILIRNRDKERIFEILQSAVKERPVNQASRVNEPGALHPPGRTRALLKIQDGCDHFCSYCIVPHVRGKPVSRPFDEVIDEARLLAKEGYKEIVLTGIHLGAYGADSEGTRKLPGLLRTLAKRHANTRFRLSSIEPADFSGDLLLAMTELPQVCRHVHLPLQHASPAILKRMERGYTISEYEEILDSIYKQLPEAAITSDIIAGFPGESHEDFEVLLRFIDRKPFYKIHVFKFSPRAGTKAALFKNTVKEEEKRERSSRLIKLGDSKMKEFSLKFLGKTMEVLVEEVNGRMLSGLTGNYLKVIFEGEPGLKGELVPVRILELAGDALRGEIAQGCAHFSLGMRDARSAPT